MTREQETRADCARELAALYAGPSTQLQAGCDVMTVGEAVSFALAFADAEAAAMRERAAGVAQGEADDIRRVHQAHDTWQGGRIAMAEYIASHIRALPATGEVGRD